MSLVQLTVPPLSTCKVLASRYFVVVPAIVSVAPEGMIVVPLPDCRPPVQLILDDSVTFPAPVSVPPDIVNVPLIVDAAAIVKVPPERIRSSLQVRLLMELVPEVVTVLPPPIPITASSPAPGTVSVSQLVAVFQLSSPAPSSQVMVAASPDRMVRINKTPAQQNFSLEFIKTPERGVNCSLQCH